MSTRKPLSRKTASQVNILSASSSKSHVSGVENASTAIPKKSNNTIHKPINRM